MISLLPYFKQNKKIYTYEQPRRKGFYDSASEAFEKIWSFFTGSLGVVCLLLIFAVSYSPVQSVISPLIANLKPLTPLSESRKGNYEVFGFAPYWTFQKLSNVDFDTLTTLAYFGVDVDAEGNLVKDDQGYRTFISDRATELFKKAHAHNTRVVLTVTQMDNANIRSILDNPEYQENAVRQIVREVKNRGIDGVNVDFEYVGNPGAEYRNKYTKFVAALSKHMHEEMPDSRVTVSVYASSVREPKLYDIGDLAKNTDGIFMMAYDFAVAGSEQAMPTAPLYGRHEGKYGYDVSSSVEEFLSVMPAEKLIMGVPYYGYDYLVYEPAVKASTRPYAPWRGTPNAKTYEYTNNNIMPDKVGWDDTGKVGWKAYYVSETDTWRMIFLDDERSLRYKYEFAKAKNLQGVGMWALGFDNGESRLWALLREQFGTKFADGRLAQKQIKEIL